MNGPTLPPHEATRRVVALDRVARLRTRNAESSILGRLPGHLHLVPTSTQRRMNSSGLSASGVSDSVGVGVGDELVGSGIFGVGSGSSEHPASRSGDREGERECAAYVHEVPSREQRQHA